MYFSDSFDMPFPRIVWSVCCWQGGLSFTAPANHRPWERGSHLIFHFSPSFLHFSFALTFTFLSLYITCHFTLTFTFPLWTSLLPLFCQLQPTTARERGSHLLFFCPIFCLFFTFLLPLLDTFLWWASLLPSAASRPPAFFVSHLTLCLWDWYSLTSESESEKASSTHSLVCTGKSESIHFLSDLLIFCLLPDFLPCTWH